MSVKFEFVLSDTDASTLLDIFCGEITRLNQHCMKFIKPQMNQVEEVNLAWYNHHIEYLESLRDKIAASSTRIED